MRIAARARICRTTRLGTLAAALIGSSAGLIGCAEVDRALQPPPVNPSSPIAPYAEQVSRENFPAPGFQDVPPKPTDVRPAPSYKQAVVGEVAMRRELAQWRAAHPDLQSDTEAWADLQRHKIPHSIATPVPETQDAESEAFAKRLREEAGKPQQ
jgi:hypothetical protein